MKTICLLWPIRTTCRSREREIMRSNDPRDNEHHPVAAERESGDLNFYLGIIFYAREGGRIYGSSFRIKIKYQDGIQSIYREVRIAVNFYASL